MTVDEQLPIELAGEQLILMAERAIFWPRRRALLVADLHWGKAATMRAAGLAIPPGTTGDDLARLDRALDRSGAAALIVLGDALHARAGRGGAAFERIAAWRARRPDMNVTLVRGNHDRHAGDPPPEWGWACVDAPFALAPFTLAHKPQAAESGYVLAGHLHPAARLRGPGRQSLRLPCFWFGSRLGVLPAFGSFTGATLIEPRAGDQVFVLVENSVLAVT
jgi:DNA ligase-associated metallophosphoesterase